MDYNNLLLILMKWSLENKEYELTYNLFTNWNIGIPVKYTYSFNEKNTFFSISSFLQDSNTISTNDKHLKNILISFRNSKYIKLQEWGNIYGYKYLL